MGIMYNCFMQYHPSILYNTILNIHSYILTIAAMIIIILLLL
jgi:hypothetical protein